MKMLNISKVKYFQRLKMEILKTNVETQKSNTKQNFQSSLLSFKTLITSYPMSWTLYDVASEISYL